MVVGKQIFATSTLAGTQLVQVYKSAQYGDSIHDVSQHDSSIRRQQESHPIGSETRRLLVEIASDKDFHGYLQLAKVYR